jgi:hypothetical protein
MKRFLETVLVVVIVAGAGSILRADDNDVKAILDKAKQALGGEEKLSKATTASWKSKGTFTFMGNDNEFTGQTTAQGLDHYRLEFQSKVNDMDFKFVMVVNGEKGWRKPGDQDVMEMDADAVANEKRNIYVSAVSGALVQINGKEFKAESAGEDKVGDKPASVVKVTGPDGKDFKIFFDKESGLPVKVVAKLIGFDGQEFTQETTYSDYKEFDGIKRATKVSSKRDGEKFIDVEVSEFKVLDKVDAETFAQPK